MLEDRSQLHDRGWMSPLDSSPVEIPDDWFGGRVRHTGGGIYCREWRTVEDPGEIEPGEVFYEIAYNGDFLGVSLQRYCHDDDIGYMFDGEIANTAVSDNTDEACAEAARDLMERYEDLI